MILAWWAFTITFVLLRLATLLLHLRDEGHTTKGGLDLHHYLWGLLLISVIAAVGLTDHAKRWRSWMGVGFGIGLALIVDEIALFVALQDVY